MTVPALQSVKIFFLEHVFRIGNRESGVGSAVNLSVSLEPGPASAARGRDPRSGIALVIVLGMMALLMILAVGFFVAMRTERLAARSFADEVRARQMAHAAITRAVADVNAEFGTRVSTNWPNVVKVSPGGGAFPSISTNVTDHVPQFLLTAVTSQAGTVGWINAPYGNGRFAYMVVNVSGFLDPNRDYSVTNSPIAARSFGYDANEIAYDQTGMGGVILTELSPTPATAALMITGRTPLGGRNKPYLRAETVPDLWIVGRYNYGGPNPLLGRPQGFPQSLFPYSYFPIGYRDAAGVAQNSIPVHTVAAVQARQGDIQAVLQNDFAFNAANAAAFVRGMIDFLDTDFVPGALDEINNEAVPKLHQFGIGAQLTDAGSGRMNAAITLRAQVWYPYVAPTNALPYSLRANVTLTWPDGTQQAVLLPATPFPMPRPWRAKDAANFTEYSTVTINAAPLLSPGILPPAGLTVNSIEVIQGATVVNRITGPRHLTWGTFFSPTLGEPMFSWWWVGDPRINWIWIPTAGAAGTAQGHWRVGGIRGAAPAAWTAHHASVTGYSGGTGMYARNADGLRSVGKLATLGHGDAYYGATPAMAPTEWGFIPLLDNTAAGIVGRPLFDRFTVHTRPLQGIVNPNALNHRPMAAALLNVPLERYPGEPGAARLTAAQALQVATAIRDEGANAVRGPFLNRSDLRRVPIPVGANVGAREGLMRNAAQLLSPRQNLFLVIVRGQALSPTGGIVMGEAQAVALVWRDPYLVNGRNQTRIRWIKWLEE